MAQDMIQVNLLMDPRDVKKVDKAAEKIGISRSALMRIWVKDKLKEG